MSVTWTVPPVALQFLQYGWPSHYHSAETNGTSSMSDNLGPCSRMPWRGQLCLTTLLVSCCVCGDEYQTICNLHSLCVWTTSQTRYLTHINVQLTSIDPDYCNCNGMSCSGDDGSGYSLSWTWSLTEFSTSSLDETADVHPTIRFRKFCSMLHPSHGDGAFQ